MKNLANTLSRSSLLAFFATCLLFLTGCSLNDIPFPVLAVLVVVAIAVVVIVLAMVVSMLRDSDLFKPKLSEEEQKALEEEEEEE